MLWKERKPRHDDEHFPMCGKGKRAIMPKGKRKKKPSKEFIEKNYIDPLKTELLERYYKDE